MSKIHTTLNSIAVELLRFGINVDQFLRPGLTASQIENACKTFPFELPKGVMELFMWRDGAVIEAITSQTTLFPGYYFLPLQRCIDTTKALISTVGMAESQWNHQWFSLWEDLAGDYYAVVSNANDSHFERIMRVTELVPPFPAFWSFECMLLSILECYRIGAYYIDEDGFLDEDTGLSDGVYRRFNKGLSPVFGRIS